MTTWIGAELSYIQDGINAIGLDVSAYSVFFHSLAYSFYPFLTLVFVLMLIFSGRDFGPMLKAERKARLASSMETDMSNSVSRPAHIIDALIPLTVLIFGTIIGLIATGYDASVWQAETDFFSKLSETIGAANSYKALLWASVLSLLTAILMTLLRGDMKFGKIMEEMVEGFKSMFNAVLILTMAWSIALVTKDMHTAEFVSQLLVQWSLSPVVVPVLTFLLAALIGFSTGTSWGTMAILYPLILPALWLLCQEEGMSVDTSMPLFYNVVASVLAGSMRRMELNRFLRPSSSMALRSSGCRIITSAVTAMPATCWKIHRIVVMLKTAARIAITTTTAIPLISCQARVFFTHSRVWYIRYAIIRTSTTSVHRTSGILSREIKSLNEKVHEKFNDYHPSFTSITASPSGGLNSSSSRSEV